MIIVAQGILTALGVVLAVVAVGAIYLHNLHNV